MNPGMESHNQSEKQSSPGSSSVSKKVALMWERMNEGVPKKRVNFHSKTSTANNVSFFFSFFLILILLSSGTLNVIYNAELERLSWCGCEEEE